MLLLCCAVVVARRKHCLVFLSYPVHCLCMPIHQASRFFICLGFIKMCYLINMNHLFNITCIFLHFLFLGSGLVSI